MQINERKQKLKRKTMHRILKAEEEIRHAFEYRRKSDNKNAILEAGKAFESTLKTICDKKGYAYNKDKDTAKKLICILENVTVQDFCF